MAHSIYTSRAVDYVIRNPGCTKMELAKALRRNARYNPSKLYRLVNTQIRLKNIVAVAGQKRGTYALYTREQWVYMQQNRQNQAS